ncbi:MAG: hypothetical protein Q8L88_16170, partial [Bacteroidota bacterium]|nr:hypothetical protein [Bacteroidota bacterium]
MNKILNKLIFLTILFLVGCAANKEFYFSNEYNIKGFQYVHIPQLFYDEGKREDIYGVRVIATKYLRSKGFLVIEENEVRKLSLSAQGLVLICNISHDYDNTRIELTTIDAQKVYSGFGENAGTFDSFHGNYDAGISNAFSGFSNYRHSYNPKYAYDPIKKIKEQYKDWERVVQTEVEIRNYLDSNISKIDPIEGIWTETNDKQYRIAITKDLNKKNRDFLISILETDNPYW